MPATIHLSDRSHDSRLPGAVFPVTRALFDDIVSRGENYVVYSDAASFAKLKRLDKHSGLFFLIEDGTDAASLHGRFRLLSRPELDSDPSGESYLATFRVELSEPLKEISKARFRAGFPQLFTSETTFTSDLDAQQLQFLVHVMTNDNHVMPSTSPSPNTSARRESIHEPSPYDAPWRSRRPQPPSWNEEERADQRREPPWTGPPYSSGPREQREYAFPFEGWRRPYDAERHSPVPPHNNETLALSSVMQRDGRVQTEEDPRIAQLTAMHAQLAAENDRLRMENVNLLAEKAEQVGKITELRGELVDKNKEMDSIREEMRRMRLVLFRHFQDDAFGSDASSEGQPDDPADPVSSAAIAPGQTPEALEDSSQISPRNTYNARCSPPPLHSGSCYSPVPNRVVSPRAASPQRGRTDVRAPEEPSLPANTSASPHHVGQRVPLNPPRNAGLPSPPAEAPTQPGSYVSYTALPPALPYGHGQPSMWNQQVPGQQSYPVHLNAPHLAMPQRPAAPAHGMPTPPATAPVHAVTEQMAIVGGLLRHQASPTMDVFDVDRREWRRLLDFQSEGPFAWGASALFGEKLFLIGGTNKKTAVNTVRRYDFQTSICASLLLKDEPCVSENWNTLLPMPTSRTGVPAADLNGKVYVIGELYRTIRTTEIYNPELDEWQDISPPNDLRCAHGVTSNVNRSTIFIFGGIGPTKRNVETVEQYDPRQGSWTMVGKMPTVRRFLSGACNGDDLFVLGGSTDRVALPTVEIFDLRALKWRTGPNMNYTRSEGAPLFLKEDLYVVGGYDEDKNVRDMERMIGGERWETHLTDGSVDARCFHRVLKIPVSLTV